MGGVKSEFANLELSPGHPEGFIFFGFLGFWEAFKIGAFSIIYKSLWICDLFGNIEGGALPDPENPEKSRKKQMTHKNNQKPKKPIKTPKTLWGVPKSPSDSLGGRKIP